MLHRIRRHIRAFSLLELMAVVMLIGLLATILTQRVTGSVEKAREHACYFNRALVNVAVETYAQENGVFPATLDDLDDPGKFPDGIPLCPVNEVKYTLDAVTHRVIGHTGAGKVGDHF